MTRYEDPTNFAWIITEDLLYKSDKDTFSDETGTIGPSESPDDLSDYLHNRYVEWPAKTLNQTESGKKVYRHIFRIYDDDQVLYYRGVLVTYADKPSDEALMAPLYDFGGPSAGAVLIKYENHSEWTIEY